MTAAQLAGRLDTGWDMCEAEPDPRKQARLEDHWLNVLRQYEAACDMETVSDRATGRPEQVEMRVSA